MTERTETNALTSILRLASEQELEAIEASKLEEASHSLLTELRQLEASVKSLSDPPIDIAPYDVQRLLRRLATEEFTRAHPPVENALNREVGMDSFVGAGGQVRQIGDYELLQKIGRGSTGTVYLAKHKTRGSTVAIKLLHENAGLIASARFAREMKVLASLNSPHIVSAVESNDDENRSFLVMEYVSGETFSSLSKSRAQLACSTACDYIRQACMGLAAAHQASIVHRDIKPANLILDRNGIVKILDFGLASVRHAQLADSDDPPSLTASSNLMGTIDYISPEQIEDPRAADLRSDIYSLGCVLYLLLAGMPPFSSDEYPADVARLMAHLSMEPMAVSDRRKDGAPGVDAIVAKMLSKRPQDRFQTAREVAEALTPWCHPRENA